MASPKLLWASALSGFGLLSVAASARSAAHERITLRGRRNGLVRPSFFFYLNDFWRSILPQANAAKISTGSAQESDPAF
jgi:hypothetical protein